MNHHELEVGSVYFNVTFHDRNLLLPDIKTYVYLGENLLANDIEENTFFFQGAEQYVGLGRWEKDGDPVRHNVMTMKEGFLEYIFDYTGLQDQIEIMKKGGARYYP